MNQRVCEAMNASSWATPSCRSRATRRRSSSTAERMFAASSLAISRTAAYASATIAAMKNRSPL